MKLRRIKYFSNVLICLFIISIFPVISYAATSFNLIGWVTMSVYIDQNNGNMTFTTMENMHGEFPAWDRIIVSDSAGNSTDYLNSFWYADNFSVPTGLYATNYLPDYVINNEYYNPDHLEVPFTSLLGLAAPRNPPPIYTLDYSRGFSTDGTYFILSDITYQLFFDDPSRPEIIIQGSVSGGKFSTDIRNMFFGGANLTPYNSDLDAFEIRGRYDGYSGTDNYYNDYYYGNYSLTVNPVPEPSTIFLLGSGLLGLWGYVKRRHK